MKMQRILGVISMIALVMPMFANAEIYKWKDKNGVTRYSDTPPPVTIKADMLGKSGAAKKKTKVKISPESQIKGGTAQREKSQEQTENSKEEAARLRARNAETQKRNELEKKKMEKLDKENCKVAKSNYQTFSQGGRIYKTNAEGEREYYGDDELSAQKLKAQQEMKKYCK